MALATPAPAFSPSTLVEHRKPIVYQTLFSVFNEADGYSFKYEALLIY